MLFKAYPTYMCSLKDIFCIQHILRLFNNIIVLYCTTYLVQQRILLFNIHGLYNMFVQQHKYVFEQHIYVIEFYRTYLFHVSSVSSEGYSA